MTKQNRIKATEPHIVVAGHVTQEELLRNLNDTEMANGFGNRFVWLAVRRSKYLPFSQEADPPSLAKILKELGEAATHASPVHEVGLTEEAMEKWKIVYPILSKGHPGLSGALLGRAEAQTRRIAALYALLDKKSSVDVDHLCAALALWQYAEDSVKWIFGARIGDPMADTIYEALSSGNGLDDTGINKLFHKNISASRLAEAKKLLVSQGKIECVHQGTDGRDKTVWAAVTKKTN